MHTVIVGTQWGDEGKGKITDLLCEDASCVVRFQGGNNAGHTVVVGNNTYKLHLLPSGIIHQKPCFIAAGVVIDPKVLLHEISQISASGLTLSLGIDPRATLIMPYHRLMDAMREKSTQKLGTTKKGIGPAYEDRFARRALRIIDMYSTDFAKKVSKVCEWYNVLFLHHFGIEKKLDVQLIVEEYLDYAKSLKQYIVDVSEKINQYDEIMFESAQGTFLDIYFGTYPFVTSSHPIAGSVFVNVGMGPCEMRVVGVMKAYTTRVGEGPFPTEQFNASGEHLRKVGNEFGTTTGRPRRCGWLDLVMMKKSVKLNGITEIAMTKLDVLTGLETIKIATAYYLDGKKIEYPITLEELEKVEVHYKEFSGFDVNGALSKGAKEYIAFIEKELGIPIRIVSIGPKRSETLFL